jgi:hypothetical protein
MYRVLYSGQAITEAAAPTLTDAQKVESALAACTLAANTTADITLPVVEGVAWSLKAASDYAVIENGVLKVTRPEHATGNVKVVVVATATFGTESDSKEIEVEIVAKEDSGIKEVTEFDALKTYKLGLYQANLSKQLWLTTGIDQDRFAISTENPADSVNVKVVTVDGGYHLVINDSKYLEFANNAAGKLAVVFLDAPTAAWTYSAEYNTFLFTYSGTTYFLGTYNTFATFSGSAEKYLSQGNFITHLYEVAEGYQPEQPEQPEQPPVIENGLVLTSEALFAGCTGTAYAGYNGNHTLNGITYATNQTMIAQGSSAKGVEGYFQLQAEKGTIANKTAYEKAVKTIVITFWNTYETPNMPTLKAGATADALTTVTANLSAGTLTGVKNPSGYEYYEYIITYTLPEGCYFWEIASATKGIKYFSQIVLGF